MPGSQKATCIGCGCDDYHACVDEHGPCSWIVVDYAEGVGVCSCCEPHVARWRAGDRTRRMLVAKIVKEGVAEPYYIERNDMDALPHLLGAVPGERFNLEWIALSVEEFEALPQFEHVRLARQWEAACMAADEAERCGRDAELQTHIAEIARLESEIGQRGFDVRNLV